MDTKNSFFTLKRLVLMAMLTAISLVIYYLDFPVPLMPSFIKFDLSNVVSLFAGLTMGPISGVIVCFLKNLIHLFIKGFGTTMGIGDIFDFVTGAVFALSASLLYRKFKSKYSLVISAAVSTLIFALVSLPLNYFIVYPIYFKAFGGEEAILEAYKAIRPGTGSIFEALCIFNFPFTLVKGIVCSLVSCVIFKPLSVALKIPEKKI